jgi:Sec-independent protein translocase protein TatA
MKYIKKYSWLLWLLIPIVIFVICLVLLPKLIKKLPEALKNFITNATSSKQTQQLNSDQAKLAANAKPTDQAADDTAIEQIQDYFAGFPLYEDSIVKVWLSLYSADDMDYVVGNFGTILSLRFWNSSYGQQTFMQLCNKLLSQDSLKQMKQYADNLNWQWTEQFNVEIGGAGGSW